MAQKQRLSIYKIYKVYFCWEKSPCGSAPRSTRLRKSTFYVFKTQKRRFSIYEIQKVYFCWKKSPCGSAPRSTKLRKSMFSMLNTQKPRFYISKIKEASILLEKKPLRERTQEHRTWKVIYIFLTNTSLYLPHIIGIFGPYLCICNT